MFSTNLTFILMSQRKQQYRAIGAVSVGGAFLCLTPAMCISIYKCVCSIWVSECAVLYGPGSVELKWIIPLLDYLIHPLH